MRGTGRRVLPPWKKVLLLVAAGIFVQLIGNLAYQWALGLIGLAIVVPLTMGTMVVSSAIGGRVLLRENVSPTLTAALGVLIVSVFILSLGGQQAGEQISQGQSPWVWLLAGVAACAAGFSYATLGITIRSGLKSPIPLATPMVIVGICGVICLGSVTLGRFGLAVVEQTSTREWFFMWAAALSNSFAFLSLTFALKRLPVIYVNAINVSQVAMAALVGVFIFLEPMSTWLITGILVMVLGFVLMTRGKSRNESADPDPQPTEIPKANAGEPDAGEADAGEADAGEADAGEAGAGEAGVGEAGVGNASERVIRPRVPCGS